MNSIPYGVIILAGILYSVIFSSGHSGIFVNTHALILVVGGCFGVFFLSTPFATIRVLGRLLFSLVKSQAGKDLASLHQSLMQVAKSRSFKPSQSHPLIIQAQELWEQGVETELFRNILSQKLDQLNNNSAQAVAAMRNLAKYPPSLGMMGTVIGLVGLFSGMTAESRNQIGPNLAVAMTATFYGLILANLLIMPLSDRLHSAQLASAQLNEQVYQTLLLIHQQEIEPLIDKTLRSYAS